MPGGFTPGEKIALARTHMGPKGWSQSDLATALAKRNALGLNDRKWRARIANYEACRPQPPERPLREIADAMNISLTWFLDPEGSVPIFRGTDAGPVLDAPRALAPAGKFQMVYAGEVPCSTAWGNPLEATEPIFMDADFAGAQRFVCRVVNDSCYPALEEGDLTVWEHDFQPPFGVIVLAQRKGDHACTAKLLRFDPEEQRPRLVPINPNTPPPADGDGWGTIARLVGVERDQDGFRRRWYLPAGLRPKHLGS